MEDPEHESQQEPRARGDLAPTAETSQTQTHGGRGMPPSAAAQASSSPAAASPRAVARALEEEEAAAAAAEDADLSGLGQLRGGWEVDEKGLLKMGSRGGEGRRSSGGGGRGGSGVGQGGEVDGGALSGGSAAKRAGGREPGGPEAESDAKVQTMIEALQMAVGRKEVRDIEKRRELRRQGVPQEEVERQLPRGLSLAVAMSMGAEGQAVIPSQIFLIRQIFLASQCLRLL
jgi:hypothetical protein